MGVSSRGASGPMITLFFASLPSLPFAPTNKAMKKFLLFTTLVLPASNAFQFMKGWKMPTYDPYEEAVKDKFGDKSEYSFMLALNASSIDGRLNRSCLTLVSFLSFLKWQSWLSLLGAHLAWVARRHWRFLERESIMLSVQFESELKSSIQSISVKIINLPSRHSANNLPYLSLSLSLSLSNLLPSLDKMEAVAEVDGFDMDNFTPMYCELNSFDSVRKFCDEIDNFRMSKPIDRLICNAGVYQPSLPYPKWSLDNHEQTMQINFLSHFLMISKLMDSMMDSTDPRVVMVGSVTGNDNTVGGGGVYPIADLHDLAGFKKGFNNPISMADGYRYVKHRDSVG